MQGYVSLHVYNDNYCISSVVLNVVVITWYFNCSSDTGHLSYCYWADIRPYYKAWQQFWEFHIGQVHTPSSRCFIKQFWSLIWIFSILLVKMTVCQRLNSILSINNDILWYYCDPLVWLTNQECRMQDFVDAHSVALFRA